MKHLWIAHTWINALLREFERLGLDVAALTRDLPGFEQGQFSKDDRLDLLSARMLWHRAAKLSKDPLLGAKIGITTNQRSIGVLAPILWHSPTIAQALRNIAKFQMLISENGAFRFSEHVELDEMHCIYEPSPAALQSSAQQILSVTVASISIINMLSGGLVKPKQLLIPAHLPAHAFEQLLSIKVQAKGEQVAFVLGLEEINQPIIGCDNVLYNTCLDYANSMLNASNAGGELIQSVRRYIANNGMLAADLSACAALFNCSERQLQRQLASLGTSFRKIKDEVLKERTIAELDRCTEVADLAQLLGYSELSGFYRAFKAWFGQAPKKALKNGLI